MKYIIAIILTCLMSSNANAFGRRFVSSSCGGNHCRGSYCAAPYVTYQENVVVQEVVTPVFAYPILVPAYQFQYVPQAFAATTPVIPVSGYPMATPVGQPFYPQQPAPQQQNFGLNNKDKIRELAKALLEEMSKMSADDTGPPAVLESSQANPNPQTQNLAQLSVNAMARTCSQCHTGVGSKGDLVIFSQPGLLNQQTNWNKIKKEIISGRMPPKDTHFQLTIQERQYISQWLTSIGAS